MFLRFKVFFIISVFILLNGCAGTVFKPIAPEVEIVNVELGGMSFPVTNVVFSIAVNNPNDFDIHVAHIDMEFHVLDHLITSQHWTDLDVLYSHQTQDMQIPVKVNLLNVFPIMSQLMSEAKLPYMISGSVQLKNYGNELPFLYKGVFSNRQANKITVNNNENKSEIKTQWF